MEATVQQLDPATVQVTIEVDAETTQKAIHQAIRQLGKSVRVPGFRPGHAPVAQLRQMIPEEYIAQRAKEILVEAHLLQAIIAHQIEPYRAPKVDIEQFQEGEPFRFKATIPLRPVVELGEYHDLRFPVPPQETSDEEVQQAFDTIRDQLKRLERVSGRPAQTDDQVVVQIRSLEEDDAKPNRYRVVLGKSFGELDNALVGMSEGETKQVTLNFPESFDAPELAGKIATVELTVQQIYAPIYPEINDEFAQGWGYTDLNAMQESIRNRISVEKETQLKDQAREAALATLRERSTVHLPEPLIEEQLREEVEEFVRELHSSGMTPEMFLKQTGMSQEQLIHRLRERGVVRLQNTFLLLEIANREGIEATEDEVEAALNEMIQNYARTPQERVRLQEDESFRDRLANELRIEKALQKLEAIIQNDSGGNQDD
ncbi:MAG: trigger factor [Fimbriimonadales bacterium]